MTMHVAHAAEPLGLEHHPAQPRVDRQPGEAPADLGQLARPRRWPAGRDRAELLEQLDAGRARCAGPAARRTGSARCRPARSEVICRMTAARLVRRISGSVNSRAATRSPPRSTAGSRCRRRRGRSGRSAGWPRPGEIGSIGSRCTLVRCGVARDAGDAGVDDVPDARARSARSRRRWWPARSRRRAARRCEDPVLLGGRQPRDRAGAPRRRAAAVGLDAGRCRASAASRISRSPGRKTRMSPGPSARELLDRVDDRLGLVA